MRNLFVLLSTFSLFALEPPPAPKIQSGAFGGIGGSYNSVRLGQQLTGTEFSSVFSGSSLVALGESGGTVSPSPLTSFTFAPQGQLGYLHRFASWTLGCKAAYQYIHLTFTDTSLDSFTPVLYSATNGNPNLFVGHLRVGSSTTCVNHELFFLPLFGCLFNDSSLYLGAGPVLWQLTQDLSGVLGWAQINGSVPDVVGDPVNFSFSQWIWGGIAQIGWVYPFASGWFIDLNYSYAVTPSATAQDSTLFSNSLISSEVYREEGIVSVQTKQNITAQSLTLTLNKIF